MKSLAIQQMPPELSSALEKVGRNIRRARLRGGITQEDLARRVMINRKTLIQLEKGSSEVGIGILLRTLNALGIDESFKNLASPEMDKIGQALETRRLPKRAKRTKRLADFLNRVQNER